MTAKIINGTEIAENIKNYVKEKVSDFEKTYNKKPGLAVIMVGSNQASKVYVGIKQKTAKEAGINSMQFNLPKETNHKELIELIKKLNEDEKVHGILIQLPLPEQLDEQRILEKIKFRKDVDGFHSRNMGKLVFGRKEIVPCTPKGIIKLIESTGQEIEGKHAVVVGRSNIVGKPIAMLLLEKNATVTICHSKTKDLKKHTKDADILVVAAGKPKLITKDMVKKNAIVIDVGINRTDDGTEKGKLVGDVDFDSVKEVAGFISPVPGGVGPMTVASLLLNTFYAARHAEEKKEKSKEEKNEN